MNLVQRLESFTKTDPSQVIWLWGEAGAGKSFLLSQTIRLLPYRCFSIHATKNKAVQLLEVLPQVPQPAWSVMITKQNNEEALIQSLVATLFELAPCLLCVEDIHEASAVQQIFWQKLSAEIQKTKGIAMVMSSRVPPDFPITTIAVPRLDLATTHLLLEREMGWLVPSAVSQWIYARTSGNPLFTLEFFKWLIRFGHLWNDTRTWYWREPKDTKLPTRVEVLIEQALESALRDTAMSQALCSAALLGSQIRNDIWQLCSGLSQSKMTSVTHRLERLGILRHAQFTHPLFREVILETADASQRTTLAQQIFAILKPQDPIAAAELLQWVTLDAATHLAHLEEAIIKAVQLQDWLSAARLQVQLVNTAQAKAAVALLKQPPAELLLLAATWLQPHQLSEALSIIEEAILYAPDRFEIIKLQIEILARLGKYTEAKALLAAQPKTALWHESQIIVLHRGLQHNKLLDFWETTMQRQIPSATIARAVARASVHCGKFEQAQTVIGQGLELESLSNYELAQLRYAALFIAHAQHQWKFAIHRCTAFIATSSAYPDLIEGAYQLRAYAHSALGNPKGAISDIQQSLNLLAQSGHAVLYAQRQSELGYYTLQHGHTDQAEHLLREARLVLERNQQTHYCCYLERFTALLHWQRQDHNLALNHAQRALQLATQSQDNHLLGGATHTLALIEATFGSPTKALELRSQLIQLRGENKSQSELIHALACEKLGQKARAEILFQTAQLNKIPMYFEFSPDSALLEYTRFKNNTGNAEKLRQHLEQTEQGGLLQLHRRYFGITQPSSIPALEVLGEMRWYGNALGERGRKAKELLVILLEARIEQNPAVSSNKLLQLLYPEIETTQANASLKQLIYRVRGFYGHDIILRTENGYVLKEIQTDVELYLKHHNPELWRGIYIHDLGNEHPSSIREQLIQTLHQDILELQKNRNDHTPKLIRILLEMDAYNLEFLRLGLRIFQDLNQITTILHIYNLGKLKQTELGIELPVTWQEFLHSPSSIALNLLELP
ncbi:MAG: hypothetical protein RLZZ156_910 [Deinococcota bacterium]|jgi:hypothetical protein